MSTSHWSVIAGCLLSLGAMTAALSSWDAALTPAFLGGVLGVLGTQITAIYLRRPQDR